MQPDTFVKMYGEYGMRDLVERKSKSDETRLEVNENSNGVVLKFKRLLKGDDRENKRN